MDNSQLCKQAPNSSQVLHVEFDKRVSPPRERATYAQHFILLDDTEHPVASALHSPPEIRHEVCKEGKGTRLLPRVADQHVNNGVTLERDAEQFGWRA